ncbi:hypothetical protein GOV14_05505 [Candidatus Pacearchaeota archaeon]|nr:hypothetical protein [Candidatus Pacearchaeota archaeon]
MDKKYEQRVNEIRKRLHKNQYGVATKQMRSLACHNLINIGLEIGLEEHGIIGSSLEKDGPYLVTNGEAFKGGSEEEYGQWYDDFKEQLDESYKCDLTEEHCVVRKTGFYLGGSGANGRCRQAYVEINKQTRCPAFWSK